MNRSTIKTFVLSIAGVVVLVAIGISIINRIPAQEVGVSPLPSEVIVAEPTKAPQVEETKTPEETEAPEETPPAREEPLM